MAPNVTVHFWNANDINAASPILEITDEDEFFRGFRITPDLYGLGGWELTLARRVGFQLFDSGAVQPEVFVRFLIHAWSDTEYYFGGMLQKRDQVVVHREEQGEETFIFGGPGPKAYLDRYRLGIEQLTGTGWNLDLENGVWAWTETATAGRVLNRVVAEDAAAADPALPDLTKTFTDANDSSSTPWTNDVAGAGEYEIPIGQSLLTTVYDLEDLADLFTSIDLGDTTTKRYRLEAWQTFGDDVTGSSPGAGVGLLREGLNIANDSLKVEGVGIRKCSHVIVEGKDGAWATAVRPTWSSGDVVKWGKIEYTRSSNVNILEKAGLRWLRRQDNGDKQITVEIVPGASEATGYYFPGPGEVLWVGNTVTLDTAEDGSTHTPLDYNNEDQLLTGLEIVLGPAGDTASADKKAKSWDVKVRLNHERAGFARSPDQTSAATGNNPCKCPSLCHSTVEGTPDSQVKFYTADPGGDALNWVGSQENGSGEGANGTDQYFFKSGSPNEYQTSWAAAAGAVYSVVGYVGCTSDGVLKLAFTTAAAGSASPSVEAGLISEEVLTAAQPGHQHAPVWSGFTAGPFTAPVGTNSAALGRNVGVDFDEVSIDLVGTPSSDPYAGTDARAARCDHVHPASEIVFTPDGTISSDNAQDAIVEVAEDAAQALADALAAGGSGVEVAEVDGTPDVSGVTRIEFDGASVTDDGSGQVTVAVASVAHAHDPPAPGVHKILVKRTTNYSATPSNDSVADYDEVIEDTMTDSWWDAGDPDGFLVTADYDGLDAIITAKVAAADLSTSEYLEMKVYYFPAASGRNRPIHSSTDEDFLIGVEQQPATDGVNHFIQFVSDPITVGTGDRIFVALRTEDAQTLIPYNGRVSITLGAYILGSGGSSDPAEDTQVWMPLTTVVGGDPELVWDANDSLIPTLTPL